MSTDYERRFERIQRLLALAGSTVNEHETATAVRIAIKHLDEHPLPIRWRVKAGTKVRVVPVSAMGDLREAKAVIRDVALRGDNWFDEVHRVRDLKDITLAMSNGFVYFQRYGYAVFVPVKHVEIYL